MIPQRIPNWQSSTDDEFRAFHVRWMISCELAQRLMLLEDRLEWDLQIISGHRSPQLQQDLIDAGEATLEPSRSTHCSCPSTGADVWPIGVTPVAMVKARLGEAATVEGLRWGGGSTIDPLTGIPSDWNHLDLGPRQD